MINNKARHNLMDAKGRWHSYQLDGAVSFREPLGQTKVMQVYFVIRSLLNNSIVRSDNEIGKVNDKKTRFKNRIRKWENSEIGKKNLQIGWTKSGATGH